MMKFLACAYAPRTQATLVVTIVCSTVALAQECVDLANVMARETERVGDQAQIDIQKKASLCSSKYQSATAEQRANIEAAYGLFSGGASGSTTQIEQLQEAQCQDQYGTYWSNQQHSSEINRVSQIGADVIRACLNAKSFRLTSLQIVDEAVNASFLYGGAGDTTIEGVFVTPSQIAKCTVFVNNGAHEDLSKLQGASLKSGDNVTLACLRTPATQTGNGPLHFEGGIVGIATNSDTARVPLIAYSKPPIPEPVADALNASLNKLDSELRTWDAKGDSNAFEPPDPKFVMPPETHTPDHFSTMSCPQGYYMIGMTLFTDVNESFLQRAQVLCRPLIPR